MKSYLKAAVILFLSLYLSNKGAEASIIINEAMINPNAVSDTYGEWIELYNTGTEAVNINGWIIKDIDDDYHEISNGGTLIVPAKGCLVLGKNGNSSINGGYTADYIYGSGITLSNTIDEILIGATAGEASGISYNSASWPIEAGRSMAYDGSGDITDPANWFATAQESQYIYGTGDYGTPGEPNLPHPPVMPEPSTLLLLGSGMLFVVRKFKISSEFVEKK